MFEGQNWEGATGIQWVDKRAAVKHSYPTSEVTSADAEKLQLTFCMNFPLRKDNNSSEEAKLNYRCGLSNDSTTNVSVRLLTFKANEMKI